LRLIPNRSQSSVEFSLPSRYAAIDFKRSFIRDVSFQGVADVHAIAQKVSPMFPVRFVT
jgi:hypothetical protein